MKRAPFARIDEGKVGAKPHGGGGPGGSSGGAPCAAKRARGFSCSGPATAPFLIKGAEGGSVGRGWHGKRTEHLGSGRGLPQQVGAMPAPPAGSPRCTPKGSRERATGFGHPDFTHQTPRIAVLWRWERSQPPRTRHVCCR